MRALLGVACANLRRNKGKYFGISLMFVLVGIIVVSCFSFRTIAVHSRMELLRQNTINSQLKVVTKDDQNPYFNEDGWVRKLENTAGIQHAVARVGSVVRDEKNREDIQLIGADLQLQNQAYAFDFASKDDAALTASDSLLITQSYADKHRLSLGSRVTLSFGMQRKRFKVRGILKNNLNFMAKTDMCAQKAAVQSLVGEKGKIYSVGISIKKLNQIDVVAAAVRRLLPKKLEVQTTYDLSQYENTIEMVDISFRLLAAIGILLAMFLCYSLYREMIYERMNQMGGLKCLGVSQHELDLMYLIEYLEFSVPSAAVGILLSKPLLQKLMMTMNGYSIAVSPAFLMKGCLEVLLFLAVNPLIILWMLHRQVRGKTVGLLKGADPAWKDMRETLRRLTVPFILCLLVGGAAVFCWLHGRRTSMLVIALLAGSLLVLGAFELVLPLMPAGLQRLFEAVRGRSSAVLSIVSAEMRTTARNGIIILLCVALCTSCVTVGHLIEKSIGSVYSNTDLVLTDSDSSNADKILHRVKETGIADAIVRTDRRQVVIRGSSAVMVGVDQGKYASIAFEEPADAVSVKTLFGRLQKKKSVIISNVTAHRLHAERGSRITIRVNGKERQYKVVGIVRTFENMGQVCFVSNREFRKTGEPDRQVFLISSKDKSRSAQNKKVLLKRLKSITGCDVSTTAELSAATDASNKFLFDIIYAMIGLICVVAASGLLCNLILAIIKRNRRYAVMRVLGTEKRRLRQSLVLEALIFAVSGSLLGGVYGNVLSWVLVQILNNYIGGTAAFQPTASWPIYAAVTALCLLCYLLNGRRALKVSEVGVLRGDE